MARVSPSLLLSPDGSFDRNGAVSPSIAGTVTISAGQYGNAWSHSVYGGVSMALSDAQAPDDNVTFFVRARTRDRTMASFYPMQVGASLRARVSSGGYGVGAGNPITNTTPGVYPGDNVWYVAAVKAKSGQAKAFINGALAVAITYSGSVTPATAALMTQGSVGDLSWDVESALVYPVALPDSEIARISAISAAWSMQNAVAHVGTRRRDGLLVPV